MGTVKTTFRDAVERYQNSGGFADNSIEDVADDLLTIAESVPGLLAERDAAREACRDFLARYNNHMVNAGLLFSDIAEKCRAAITGEPARTAYRLVQDNDCHWYVIPADRVESFNDWVQCQERSLPMETELEPERVNGPHTVTFTDWKENV